MNQTQMIKWKFRDGFIKRSDDDTIVAVMQDDSTEQDALMAAAAPEMKEAIEEFVDNVNSGKMKPRTAVNKFEKILDKMKS